MRHQLALLPGLFLAPGLLVLSLGAVFWLQLFPSSWVRLLDVFVWLFTGIGLLLTLFYSRTRNFFAILFVFLTYLAIDYGLNKTLLSTFESPLDPAVSYNLISFILPLFILLNSLWSERYHLIYDKLLRFFVFGSLLTVAFLLGVNQAQFVNDAFNPVYLPWLYIEALGLPQLSSFILLLSLTVLFVQLLVNPQSYFAAQWTALLCMLLALPYFHHELVVSLATCLALIMLSLAVLQEAFQMAFRDDLTGLPGRRALNERLQRLGRNYAIAMSDVDKFKVFNDTYGHDMGDQVLKMVAAQLKRVGGGGKAYRYGGEEFTLVFPGKTAEQAKPYLEKLRFAIENYQVKLRDPTERPQDKKEGKKLRGQKAAKDSVSVTISMGVAQRGEDGTTPEEVIKAADEALYKAKKAGRNQIMVA